MPKSELSPEQKQEALVSPEKERRYPLFGLLGAPGGGKSKWAEVMKDRFDITVYQERFGLNPFLDLFYRDDPSEWSYHSQRFFAEDGFGLLRELSRTEGLKKGLVVEDPYVKQHRDVFARVQYQLKMMTDEQYSDYLFIFEALSEGSNCPEPDVLMAVLAPEEVIMDRIRERARTNELLMLKRYPEYFIKLAERVEELVRENPYNIPIIVIDSGKYNYVDNPNDASRVVTQVQKEIAGILEERKDIILPYGFA